MTLHVRPWCAPDAVAGHPQCPPAASPAAISAAIDAATLVLFCASGQRYPGARPVVAWRPGARDVSGGLLIFPARRLPIISVESITIDGEVIDADRYALEANRYVRPMSANRVVFPRGQDLGLVVGSTGTWSVDYTWGDSPPGLGVIACVDYAVQLLLARTPGETSMLPDKVLRVVREGVDISMLDPMKLLEAGLTGLALSDSFIQAVNRERRTTRPYVVNPDQFARYTGIHF